MDNLNPCKECGSNEISIQKWPTGENKPEYYRSSHKCKDGLFVEIGSNDLEGIITQWNNDNPVVPVLDDYCELSDGPTPTPCTDSECHLDREKKMLPLPVSGHCDPCIHPLVSALQLAGFDTVASCCGHKFRPSRISLKDGREIFIFKDFEEARRVDALFDTDINGDKVNG